MSVVSRTRGGKKGCYSAASNLVPNLLLEHSGGSVAGAAAAPSQNACKTGLLQVFVRNGAGRVGSASEQGDGPEIL